MMMLYPPDVRLWQADEGKMFQTLMTLSGSDKYIYSAHRVGHIVEQFSLYIPTISNRRYSTSFELLLYKYGITSKDIRFVSAEGWQVSDSLIPLVCDTAIQFKLFLHQAKATITDNLVLAGVYHSLERYTRISDDSIK